MPRRTAASYTTNRKGDLGDKISRGFWYCHALILAVNVPLVLDGREPLQRLLRLGACLLELVLDLLAALLDVLQPAPHVRYSKAAVGIRLATLANSV